MREANEVAVRPSDIGEGSAPVPREDDRRPGDDGRAARTERSPHGGWRWTPLVVGAYVVGGFAVNWSVWRIGATTAQGPGGDQFANIWYLQWASTAITHVHNPFFSASGNAPWGVNLLANTSSLFLGVVGTPLTIAWNSLLTFNVMLTVAPAVSALAAYALARRLSVSRPSAFVAGLVYGFGPYAFAQGPAAGHLNLAFTPVPPLVLLLLVEVMTRPRGRPVVWGGAIALLAVVQFFIGAEVLLSTVVVAVAVVVWTAVVGRRQVARVWRFVVTTGAWAAGIAAVLLAYPVWFALRGPQSISGPIQLAPEAYRSGLEAIVVPDVNQRLHTAHLASIASQFSSSTAENGAYLGIPLTIVVVVGVVWLWRRSPVSRVVALSGLSALLLSFGGHLTLTGNATPGGIPFPEGIFSKLPVLSNTVPSRYALYVDLAAGLLLALVVDRIAAAAAGRDGARGRHAAPAGDRRSWTAVAAAGAVAVVCLVPLIPSSVGGIEPLVPPAYFTSGAYRAIPSDSPVLLFPYPSSIAPTGQYWQASTRLSFRILGGYFLVPSGPARTIAFSAPLAYTRSTPVALTLTALAAGAPPPLTPALETTLRSQLRRDRVSTAVAFVQGIPDPGRVAAYLGAVFGYAPHQVDDALVWAHLPAHLAGDAAASP